ncbi:Oligopeptide transporter 4 [Fulvia fulva]|uniref:Oligopeptide transporter 4 n=1 Tax=Passalora fulva TaxID=5499 RepID=A0A9Q8LA20_PASFU|nr:Oligopeptide transporter 4 [Fulvia fulva]KAK4631100.1 Oligopeptide transporter 4 [Fulvia fulva]KAK4633950.1 Oligopeptide transporter 4 [Fulvia fulva]UJO13479.1 Oligopeptide transporter 4 [Fulvia fulva]WPV10916.1 Oligopeptide transporter 4 [Fulvia fulva]WPV25605.1 Oligopeptide transporter 4 [Fulvia fulva]
MGESTSVYLLGNPWPTFRAGGRQGTDVSKYLVDVRDDGDPSFTFRSMVLGSLFTALSSVITMLYQFKPVQIQVSAVFLQLLVFVFGEAWARFTPSPDRVPGRWLQTVFRFLNFGQPFGIKEHVVAALIASSGNNGLSGVDIYAVERLFYNKSVTASTAVLATFSISLCGFVLAGVLRPLIVYPAEMVYWSTLPQVILYQKLHLDRKANRDRLAKFGWALALAAIWEFFPAYMVTWFGGLSVFCLASLNAPKKTRTIFTTIFGGASSNEGMGLLNFSLDWQYIQSQYLSYPLKQQINAWIGFAIFYVVMASLYYGNAWNAKTFPFMSTSLYKADGTKFSITSVLNSQGTIDYEKLGEIGLPHLTSSTVWGFITQNLAIGALITHVVIFFGKDMVQAWKQALTRTQPDPHYQAMLKYKEVPMWWYLATFVLCFFAGLIVNLKGDTTLSAWAYIVSLLLGAFIAPFSCILYGLYGTGVSTNQLSKMVAGAVQPGKPLAGLYFASWSHQVILLAVNLANWLKVGQYTKIPPRVMFWTQIYATLLGAAFNYVVMTVIVNAKRTILLDPQGDNVWSGAWMQSLNSQAITWALAKEVYGTAGQYLIVPMGLIIGLAVPVIHWVLLKFIPRLSRWPLNTAIIASNAGQYYYGNTSFVWSTIAVGVFSQVWLRRKRPDIYNKYNYLIGAALDGGSQIVVFVLSFAVFGASGKSHPFPTWWGNPSGNPDHCL